LVGKTGLHVAARQGSYEMVRQLLDRRANATALSDDEETALDMAVRNGHVEVVRILLAATRNTQFTRKLVDFEEENARTATELIKVFLKCR
jgi:ankyrin repeat protein